MSNRYPARSPTGFAPPDYRRPAPGRRVVMRRQLPRSPRAYPIVRRGGGPPPPVGPTGSPPLGPRYIKSFARAFRFLPWLNAALLAYEAYQLWNYWSDERIDPQPSDYFICPIPAEPPDWPGIAFDWGANTAGFCTSQLPHPPNVWTAGTPWLKRWGTWDGGIFGKRWKGHSAYKFPENPGEVTITPPGYTPAPMPVLPVPFIPWIDPLVPPYTVMPHPIAPPVRRPKFDLDNPENPAPAPALAPPPPPRNPVPPAPGEKERKVKFRSHSVARRVMGKILSNYSEVGDFVDALYDALPDHLKVKDATQAEKLKALYRNINDVDMHKAMENIWENEVSDRYMGTLLGDIADSFDDYGIDLGMLRT